MDRSRARDRAGVRNREARRLHRRLRQPRPGVSAAFAFTRSMSSSLGVFKTGVAWGGARGLRHHGWAGAQGVTVIAVARAPGSGGSCRDATRAVQDEARAVLAALLLVAFDPTSSPWHVRSGRRYRVLDVCCGGAREPAHAEAADHVAFGHSLSALPSAGAAPDQWVPRLAGAVAWKLSHVCVAEANSGVQRWRAAEQAAESARASAQLTPRAYTLGETKLQGCCWRGGRPWSRRAPRSKHARRRCAGRLAC